MSEYRLIEEYRRQLRRYTLEQLRKIPEAGVWSLGQMYDHLIAVAHEYMDHVEACAEAETEQPLGKTAAGEDAFRIGGFPPVKIELPEDMNQADNPDSIDGLEERLRQVMSRMRELEVRAAAANANAKVEHGGFGWLNAREWHALIGMHFRHHLRQKRELEERLGL
ncbi:DinB family protein [Paenibacillus methanolicus]|uniref:DinB family protein n=1 Tax=Paenibacillus methanolicus TaxID=582686 RepID=A0A5S5BW29_9BACL|nr:DinB family protein [Paenibacillus methanolicus]TYP71237.1 DinB family protein [Paenibacillus methanolicus]